MHILIITGGESKEREISLKSADAVRRALLSGGHTVDVYNISDGIEGVAKFAGVDVIFPILHGIDGESGRLQKQLDTVGLPFLGSKANACELSFDKTLLKERMAKEGILTPKYQVVNRQSFDESPLRLAPFVLKPCDEGSSIDTYIVRRPDEFSVEGTDVFSRHKKMLLEELIVGQEITVPVLGDSVLPVIEIIPPEDGEFDFVNKYNGATQELCPPKNIDTKVQRQAQDLALKVHKLTGARHLSRTDMILASDELYVLELNTIPGLTDQSLFPQAAQALGLDMAALMDEFVALATREG